MNGKALEFLVWFRHGFVFLPSNELIQGALDDVAMSFDELSVIVRSSFKSRFNQQFDWAVENNNRYEYNDHFIAEFSTVKYGKWTRVRKQADQRGYLLDLIPDSDWELIRRPGPLVLVEHEFLFSEAFDYDVDKEN